MKHEFRLSNKTALWCNFGVPLIHLLQPDHRNIFVLVSHPWGLQLFFGLLTREMQLKCRNQVVTSNATHFLCIWSEHSIKGALCNNLHVLISLAAHGRIVRWLWSLSVVYTSSLMICLSRLMLLDCGFHYESLHGSLKDVTLCTFVCLPSVRYQRATVANVNLETESTNINDWLTQTIPEPF